MIVTLILIVSVVSHKFNLLVYKMIYVNLIMEDVYRKRGVI